MIVLFLAGTLAVISWEPLVRAVFVAANWKLDPWLVSWEPRTIAFVVTWGGTGWFYRDELTLAGRALRKIKPGSALLALGAGCLFALFLIQWSRGWGSPEMNVLVNVAVGSVLIAGISIGLNGLKARTAAAPAPVEIGPSMDLARALADAKKLAETQREEIASLKERLAEQQTRPAFHPSEAPRRIDAIQRVRTYLNGDLKEALIRLDRAAHPWQKAMQDDPAIFAKKVDEAYGKFTEVWERGHAMKFDYREYPDIYEVLDGLPDREEINQARVWLSNTVVGGESSAPIAAQQLANKLNPFSAWREKADAKLTESLKAARSALP